VLRDAPQQEAQVEVAIKELLKGPTSEEQAKGFYSFFSSETEGMLHSVSVTDTGRAVVDFQDFREHMNNASTSAGSAQLMQELGKTIFQFDEIKEVEYRLDGSCDTFFDWLQGSCQVIDGETYR
jgi:spore germination protein GerM